jgi:hypothetical protein
MEGDASGGGISPDRANGSMEIVSGAFIGENLPDFADGSQCQFLSRLSLNATMASGRKKAKRKNGPRCFLLRKRTSFPQYPIEPDFVA